MMKPSTGNVFQIIFIVFIILCMADSDKCLRLVYIHLRINGSIDNIKSYVLLVIFYNTNYKNIYIYIIFVLIGINLVVFFNISLYFINFSFLLIIKSIL